MAKTNSTEFLKGKLLDFIGEPDPLYAMMDWLLNELMRLESEQKVGVEKGKHSESRITYFSGKRIRRFDTRLGTHYLIVPKLRNGGYVPFFVTEKSRSEQALMGLVYEAYANGVSTRKVERLIKSLGIEGISSSQVSEICKSLDVQVEEFRNRRLEAEYPVILCDALYEKIRKNGRVVSMAILVVIGVNVRGGREILAVDPMWNESEESYTDVFNSLKARGLKKTWLIVSDAHQGIQAAVRKNFLGASWQRCKVHFMRNIMARVTQKDKNIFADKLKRIWLEADKDSARKRAAAVANEYRNKYPEAIDVLLEGLEDSLSFYDFPRIDSRKISSTNMLERLNREIRRRSRVVGVFPSEDSYVRLVGAYILEYADDWATNRSYIREESILEQRILLNEVA